MTKLRRQSSVVSCLVLMCLIGQSLFPGVADSLLTFSASVSDSAAAGCCIVKLSGAAGCCCGSKSGESCGCACGTRKSPPATASHRTQRNTDQPRTIQSEICGCGGKHRPGMITSIKPAVLASVELQLAREAAPRILETLCDWMAASLAPPTPPPKLLA
ncbi:MAG: hypothetical protein HQ518_00055 [Rhodopirellula sp.]|nr:hypothetical protein [Rhodopirellula sp.]